MNLFIRAVIDATWVRGGLMMDARVPTRTLALKLLAN